jgi:hypothetical protein
VQLAFRLAFAAGPLVRAVSSRPAVPREMQSGLLHVYYPTVAPSARLVPCRLLSSQVEAACTVHGFAHARDEPKARDRKLALVERALDSAPI